MDIIYWSESFLTTLLIFLKHLNHSNHKIIDSAYFSIKFSQFNELSIYWFGLNTN